MVLPILSVLGTCCGCMTLVELLSREDPLSMDLMTFSTFLFTTIEGYLIGTRGLTVPRKIPLTGYLKLVVIFFIVSVINNKALSYHIPVTLHIIFRSGTLLASLILGILILNRRYSVQKYASVALVTLGILVCTWASSEQVKKNGLSGNAWLEWLTGIILLFTALMLSAYLGIAQEQLYSMYGKHTREALFYVHALSLPGFLLLTNNILSSVQKFNESPPIDLYFISIPRLWLFLIILDVMQYACIRCVYALTAEFSALSVTLIVTLRKFLSLLLSILYFNSPFSAVHWLGTLMVFTGTALFADVPNQLYLRMIKLFGGKAKTAEIDNKSSGSNCRNSADDNNAGNSFDNNRKVKNGSSPGVVVINDNDVNIMRMNQQQQFENGKNNKVE